MTDITEQAREEPEGFRLRVFNRNDLKLGDYYYLDWLLKQHVQPASVTEAIEEADARERLREILQRYDSGRQVLIKGGALFDELAAALQGKAVNEQPERLFFCPYCRTPISCDGVGHKVNDAAATPSST